MLLHRVIQLQENDLMAQTELTLLVLFFFNFRILLAFN